MVLTYLLRASTCVKKVCNSINVTEKCWAQLSAHCTILGVKSTHIFPPIKPWTPMGAFGGLKHVDSINFKEKYYHAFQFEQLFWSHILLKICILFSTIYCVKAPYKASLDQFGWSIAAVGCGLRLSTIPAKMSPAMICQLPSLFLVYCVWWMAVHATWPFTNNETKKLYEL